MRGPFDYSRFPAEAEHRYKTRYLPRYIDEITSTRSLGRDISLSGHQVREGIFRIGKGVPQDWEGWDRTRRGVEYIEGERVGKYVGKSKLGNWLSSVGRRALKSKAVWVAGAGVGGIGLYNLFSGKDDNYNTITGMSEFGLAAEQRHILTDFGSGWTGLSVGTMVRAGLISVDDFAYMAWCMGYGPQMQEAWRGVSQRFSGRDDAFNTIEGMSEAGWASRLRKRNTDFGSGYDGVKALARAAGKTFEEFIGSSIFKKALAESTVLRSLGKGAFGEAFLREATISGKSFQLVEKRFMSTEAEKLGIRGIAGERMIARGPEWEAEVLKRMEGAPAVPSLYSHDPSTGSIFMEHMPGAPMAKGTTVADLGLRARTDLDITTRIAAERGLFNIDLHRGNLLVDPTTTRASWIDWGSTVETENRERALRLTREVLGLELGTTTAAYRRGPQGHRLVANTSANTLEGSSHKGIAKDSRHLHSDMGGWWQGLMGGVSERVAKYMGTGARMGGRKLLDPRRAASLAKAAGTVEEFGKAVGVKAHVIRTAQQEATYQSYIQGYRGMGKVGETAAQALESGAATLTIGGEQHIFMHPERLRTSFVQEATKHGMTKEAATAATGHEDFLKTVYYHEVLEKQSAGYFETLNRMPASHNAAQVLVGEGGFLEANANQKVRQLFTTVRGARKEEAAALEMGFKAFSEEGAAPEMRKVITDFASPYRGLLDSTSYEIAKKHSGRGRASARLTASAKDLRLSQRKVWSAAVNGGKGHLKYSPSMP